MSFKSNNRKRRKKIVTLKIAYSFEQKANLSFFSRYLYIVCDMLNDFKCYFISFYVSLQGVKGAPYYVGAAQTLPRGMYSDRNKNIIGKCITTFE